MDKDTKKIWVEAAGGAVLSTNGFSDGPRLLMMLRRGMWDLPKGHREEGETLRECAAREVCEECGLDPAFLSVGPELIRTRHSYVRPDGLPETKQVTWFTMTYAGNTSSITPQTEEDITALEWVLLDEAARHAATSFKTIQEVIAKLIL